MFIPKMHSLNLISVIVMLMGFACYSLDDDKFCDLNRETCSKGSNARYLFYDVNPSEGFNLRRDVYMRYAVLANKLQKSSNSLLNNFKLVLPPWSHLYHWSYSREPEFIPWSYYFNLSNLQTFAPVIEMYQFFDEVDVRYTNIQIDEVYVLQHYKDMFDSGNFEEKMSIEVCEKPISTNYFYYQNVTSDNPKCLSFHGFTSQLVKVLENSSAKTILFGHGEVALHDNFGDKSYWECRRSMRFNKELVDVANDFREKFLHSNDELDNTKLPDNWKEGKTKRNAMGGPYIAVHLRRADFTRSRPKEIPRIEDAVKQISKILIDLDLNTVFVATDADKTEINTLKFLLQPRFKVLLYEPDSFVKAKYRDGGIAIVDQIICSHARYFVGTHESTFSFRIQEEREILGFPANSTFNRLCGEAIPCEKPSQWKIVY